MKLQKVKFYTMEKIFSNFLPEDRAREGIFLAFQYPVEIPGVSNTNFLKTAVNEIRKYSGEEELDAMDFLSLIKEKRKLVELDQTVFKQIC